MKANLNWKMEIVMYVLVRCLYLALKKKPPLYIYDMEKMLLKTAEKR